MWSLICRAVFDCRLFRFFLHLCRWCWNTRTKSGTNFRLSKKLLVALLRTLFREATFIPKSTSHWPETVFLLEDVFLLLLLDSSQWTSRRNFADRGTEAGIRRVFPTAGSWGGQFFPKRNSTITVACSFPEAVGMNCGECVWLKIFCTNSNVNALIKLCMTNCQLKKKKKEKKEACCDRRKMGFISILSKKKKKKKYLKWRKSLFFKSDIIKSQYISSMFATVLHIKMSWAAFSYLLFISLEKPCSKAVLFNSYQKNK